MDVRGFIPGKPKPAEPPIGKKKVYKPADDIPHEILEAANDLYEAAKEAGIEGTFFYHSDEYIKHAQEQRTEADEERDRKAFEDMKEAVTNEDDNAEEQGGRNAFLELAPKAINKHLKFDGESIVPGFISFISDTDVRLGLYRITLHSGVYFLRSGENITEALIYMMTFDENELLNVGEGLPYEETTDDETGVTTRMYKEPEENSEPISIPAKLEPIPTEDGKFLTFVEYSAWLTYNDAPDQETKNDIFNSAYQVTRETEIKPDSESKKEAIEAAKLERRAANIYYENITGFETGYSEACSKLNDMLLKELDKKEVKTTIEYTPKGWGATMRVTLPRNEVEAWKEAGGTPIQAQHLRAVIYELLKNEQEPEWWKKQKTVTLTLGQIVRGMYPNADKKPSDSEINLIARTMEMFIKSDLDSIYPEPNSKSKKAQAIDRDVLTIKGYRILPAVMVGDTNARGHIVRAAYEFWALPPLEHQSSGIHHSLTIPVLGGLLKDGKKANVTRQAYDMATALGRYVRIAKESGSCSVNYETIMNDIQPEKYEQMKTRLEAAIYTGDNEEKKKAQAALRTFKKRTKRSIDSVMPILIDKEANREEKPCYLAVHESKRLDGLTITVVKQTKKERAKHQKPRLCGYKIKA